MAAEKGPRSPSLPPPDKSVLVPVAVVAAGGLLCGPGLLSPGAPATGGTRAASVLPPAPAPPAVARTQVAEPPMSVDRFQQHKGCSIGLIGLRAFAAVVLLDPVPS